jgi:uncharacterized membrane protein
LVSDNRYSFIVITYKGRKAAPEALTAIKVLEREKQIKLGDAVAVYKSDAGKIRLQQSKGATGGKGGAFGGTLGLLLGVIAGGPLALAVVGAAVGGAAGKLLDTGIKDGVMRELGQELARDDSALCLLIKSANWGVVHERMKPFGGKILVSGLTNEAMTALDGLAQNEAVIEAVAKQIG